MSYNVAIDGPAGAGKSTIAKLVAKKKDLIYVDTGAMYRAIALYLIREKVDSSNSDAICKACQNADVSIQYIDGLQNVILNGENVTGMLRSEEVGNMASVSSANKAVRDRLLNLQKQLARECDVIMDGRDIGTCVLPNADVKIFLTASSAVRAKRRYDELTAKGQTCDLEKIEQDIIERDRRDMTREQSPLKQAQDAVVVDTSDLDIDQVVEKICSLIDCNR